MLIQARDPRPIWAITCAIITQTLFRVWRRTVFNCIQQELEVIQMDRKKAIVTGGAIGMGRGIALVLAEDSSMAASYKGW